MGKHEDAEQIKEEKPKKAYMIKIVVWDDSEVDCDIREYRRNGTGRGAPSLCGPLDSEKFIECLKRQGMSAFGITQQIAMYTGVDMFYSEKNDKPTATSQELKGINPEITEQPN
jgi:hypothetical protein